MRLQAVRSTAKTNLEGTKLSLVMELKWKMLKLLQK